MFSFQCSSTVHTFNAPPSLSALWHDFLLLRPFFCVALYSDFYANGPKKWPPPPPPPPPPADGIGERRVLRTWSKSLASTHTRCGWWGPHLNICKWDVIAVTGAIIIITPQGTRSSFFFRGKFQQVRVHMFHLCSRWNSRTLWSS